MLTREAVLPPHTLRRLAALAALAVLHMAVVYGFLELARELFS